MKDANLSDELIINTMGRLEGFVQDPILLALCAELVTDDYSDDKQMLVNIKMRLDELVGDSTWVS